MISFNSWLLIPRTAHLKSCCKSAFYPALATLSYLSKTSECGERAVQELCDSLDDTFAVIKRLTDCAEAETSHLQSIALPTDQKSLAYVQSVLMHNLSPSKVADLVNNLRSMRSEISTCVETLENSFGHVNYLYTCSHNRLMRISTSTSTSTMLPARLKLADWLKEREGTWGFLKRSRPREVKRVRLKSFHILF